jgi:hypothetical protein
MRARRSHSQRAVINIRKRLRQDMERLALTHKGCSQARGCGCLVDLALIALTRTESDLFRFEIDSYADPSTARRLVNEDNTIAIEEPPS